MSRLNPFFAAVSSCLLLASAASAAPPLRAARAGLDPSDSSSDARVSRSVSTSIRRGAPVGAEARSASASASATSRWLPFWRIEPAASNASVHGGVLPWWQHGSSDT